MLTIYDCHISGLTQYSQSRVSTQRILKFLDLDELVPYVDKSPPTDGVAIEMSNVSMSWMDEATVAQKQASEAAAAAAKSAKTDKKAAAAASAVANNKTGADNRTQYAKVPTIETDQAPGSADDVERGKGEIELTTLTDSNANASADGASAGAQTDALSPQPADAKASAKYDAELNRSVHTLVDLTFKIKTGELVAVVGTVGSGKSSLLNGLLGEMLLTAGSVRLYGRIAYCDQRPWILNDTVQGNVTFGLPYDEARFDAALYAANMEDDVIVLPGGINTQIGMCVLALVCYCLFSWYCFCATELASELSILRTIVDQLVLCPFVYQYSIYMWF